MPLGGINTNRTWTSIKSDLTDELNKWSEVVEAYNLDSYQDASNAGAVSVWLRVKGEWQKPIICSRFGNERKGAEKNLLAIAIEIKHQRLAHQRGLSEITTQLSKAIGMLDDPASPYYILGIPNGSTSEVIRAAWRAKAKESHDDSELFQRVRAAAESLGVV